MVADAKVLPPRKAALSRSIAASLARAHRRLAQAAGAAVTGLLLVKAAGDTFLCLFLATVWLLVASVASVNLGRVFGGGDACALVAAGGRVLCLAGLSMVTFSAPAILVFVHRVAAADSDSDDKEGPTPRGLAPAVEEVLGNRTVMLGVLAGLPFYVLRIVGGLQKGFSLSLGRGSEMSAVGTLGKDSVWCFILVPAIALRVWRVTRLDWR